MVLTDLNKYQVYETGKFAKKILGDSLQSFCVTPLVPSPGKPYNLGVSLVNFRSGLETLLRFERDFEVKVDSVNPLLPCSVSKSLQEYRYLLRRKCGGGRETFTVSSNGDIRPCSHSSEVYGNILEVSVEEAMKRMVKWRDGSLTPKDCIGCGYEADCGGGCRVAAEAVTGELNGNHPYCMAKVEERGLTPEVKLEEISGKSIQIPQTNYRFRTEDNNQKTVYLSPGKCATMDESHFRLLRILRSYDGKNLGELGSLLSIEKKVLEPALRRFENSGLIKIV
ncbi:MAG: SPASM domain-containing protein [Nanoarchaeota archaeon]|nr:SPASM domain-containing protein [Nanoarchaeota archaeon]